MFKDLVLQNRSYRRFFEDHLVNRETLWELVDLARLSASSRNNQPLKFILSSDSQRNSRIFPYLKWARHLPDWKGPEPGERPSAYIIIVGDTAISKEFFSDHAIAAQSILLGATEKGLGGCMIASLERDGLRKALEIPAQYEIRLVVAIGKPREKVVIELLTPGGDSKYWRDSEGVHHVPKRALSDLIIELPQD